MQTPFSFLSSLLEAVCEHFSVLTFWSSNEFRISYFFMTVNCDGIPVITGGPVSQWLMRRIIDREIRGSKSVIGEEGTGAPPMKGQYYSSMTHGIFPLCFALTLSNEYGTKNIPIYMYLGIIGLLNLCFRCSWVDYWIDATDTLLTQSSLNSLLNCPNFSPFSGPYWGNLMMRTAFRPVPCLRLVRPWLFTCCFILPVLRNLLWKFSRLFTKELVILLTWKKAWTALKFLHNTLR